MLLLGWGGITQRLAHWLPVTAILGPNHSSGVLTGKNTTLIDSARKVTEKPSVDRTHPELLRAEAQIRIASIRTCLDKIADQQ